MANEINGTALQVYQQLLTLGVAPGTAAGAVGSLMGESGKGLNTAALNRGDGADGSDSIGMGQWNQSRATALRRTAEQMGTSWTDSRAQVAHIGNELQGSHKHVLKALLAAGDDVGAGNDIWTRQYEVPADAVAIEQHPRYPAVLAGDDVGRRQRPEGTERHVAEIADRRRHHVQAGKRRGRGQALPVQQIAALGIAGRGREIGTHRVLTCPGASRSGGWHRLAQNAFPRK